MGKNSALDRKDLQILRLLQADGARSNRDLAREIGLSASACLERVRRLERDGVIERYTAVLRASAFERAVEGWAEIVFSQRTDALASALSASLSSAEIVTDFYELTGPFDLLVRFVAPSLEDWLAFSRALEETFPEIASIRYGLAGERRLSRPLAVERLAGIAD